MKVKEVMTATPCYCQPETNLAAAIELMWNANCGFLPVKAAEEKVVGVITDRDISIALGTRNRLASDVQVSEVMTGKLYSTDADDDIHVALEIMKGQRVRRLPVIAKNGSLVGVVSADDILLHAEPPRLGKQSELTADEVVSAFRAITQRQIAQVGKQAATA